MTTYNTKDALYAAHNVIVARHAKGGAGKTGSYPKVLVPEIEEFLEDVVRSANAAIDMDFKCSAIEVCTYWSSRALNFSKRYVIN